MLISRRNFLTKVTVGVAGVSLLRDVVWAQTKSKLGYMKIVDNAAMFMAMEKGFFKAEGLELETVPMAGGAVIVQGVTSGDLQFGWTNVISLYQAFVEGFDFKLIAGGATNVRGSNETHAIIVGKDSPIKQAKDLEGKTVAVNTLNNIVHLMAMAWVDKNGGAAGKIKFIEIPFPAMEAALVAGKVDAISVQEPFAAAAARRAETRVLSNPWGDVLPRFLVASWFASEKWIQKNKSTGEAFVRAINRGVDAIRTDKDGARAAMIKWAGLNPDFVGKIGLPQFEKAINEKDVQVTMDLTYKYKLISKPLKAREVLSDLARKA
ncbi:MAG: transporter substrate-binding domain-containing protein [Deltaproteobacteria bacterium]|nr:transporter substrate-binding domain-containing protein [Deltaproteobacteria bacterium]